MKHMTKMILQITAAQLLMQVILTLYNLIGHLIGPMTGSEQMPDFSSVMMLIPAGLPGILFCMLEPGLRVQNHCRKRWRHVIACLFFWGLECAAFTWIAVKLTASGLFPSCAEPEADMYRSMPVPAFFISAAIILVWLPSVWLREKRMAWLYGRDDDPEE